MNEPRKGDKRKIKKPNGDYRATTVEVEARVLHIAELMSTLRYQSFLTCQALAKEWGLSAGTVQEYADEASRRLACPKDKIPELRARLSRTFEAIGTAALNERSRVTNLPDFKSAIDAYKLHGQYSGADIEVDEQRAERPEIRIVYSGPKGKEVLLGEFSTEETLEPDPVGK